MGKWLRYIILILPCPCSFHHPDHLEDLGKVPFILLGAFQYSLLMLPGPSPMFLLSKWLLGMESVCLHACSSSKFTLSSTWLAASHPNGGHHLGFEATLHGRHHRVYFLHPPFQLGNFDCIWDVLPLYFCWRWGTGTCSQKASPPSISLKGHN